MGYFLIKKVRWGVFVAIAFLGLSISFVEGQSTDIAEMAPEELYREGVQAFSSGNFTRASELFESLIDRFGAEKEFQDVMEQVHYALASSRYGEQDFEGAIETYTIYIERWPEAKYKDEAVFLIGASHQATENYRQAIETYQRLLRESPRSEFAEDAAFQVGICYLIEENREKVLESFAAFRKRFPRSELYGQAGMYEAQTLHEMEKPREALDLMQVLQTKTRSFDHITFLNFLAMDIGDQAFEDTEYDLALSAYRRVRTRDALMRLQRKMLRRLEAQLEQLKEKRVSTDKLAMHFKKQQRIEGRIYKGAEMLKKLETTPDYDSALFHRIGKCFFTTERFWEAQVAFRRVVREAKDQVVKEAGHFDLALTLSRLRMVDELARVAEMYLEQYGDDQALIEKGRVPTIAFMKGEAFVNVGRFQEAEVEMLSLMENFPDHPRRIRIEFYLALSQAMQEKFDEAIPKFKDWISTHPDHMMRVEVDYWMPIAMYYDGQFAEALPLFQEYIKKYPITLYQPEAEYRAAMCMYSLEDFEACATALGAWRGKYPDHFFKWEALITEGDSLAGIAQLEEAKARYMLVNKDGKAFYHLALTQMSKVFKALGTEEDFRQMVRVYKQFIEDRPDSGNIVDAAYQAGWAHRQLEEADEARKLYWNTIEAHGNKRNWEGFGPLLSDLSSMYVPDEEPSFTTDLTRRLSAAVKKKRPSLSARLEMVRIRELVPEVELYREIKKFAGRYPIELMGSEVMAFTGATLINQKRPDLGLKYLTKLVEDFPESPFSASGYKYMAEAKLAEKLYEESWELANKSYDLAQDTATLMDATMLRARSSFGLKEYAEAQSDFTAVLSARSAPKAFKPEALLRIGDCWMKLGKLNKAIPFYQRIYVLYGAYTDEVAEAYLKSGLAFEKLKDKDSAIRTYEEMLTIEKVKDTKAANYVRKALAKLLAGRAS